ncbi:lysozyme family protein [Mycobacteroides abscessus]|uniref:hypothetical protein n=1 Tax=Mycobacteroides abscessus TaxID=36809 RepID=UPI00092710EA|nr:hypothetical protein [Mycobacteroides abscessus]SIK22683.1 Uncharacterised protein [Mycobacteroides abscessus subsp. abscessus]SIM54735.1 Uncharacterised protein [Mycobacteroides abscessus subsp. abscessus]SKL79013.1 Uncharacterised protein [Mycobacteroides abscessus subsp. massiliense]SKM14799.1 Uncharacterised protein [Mycobacteroides abscessus subsp. massiliense]SKO13302.1 Uncharacterised protein [Mycobacteroides abscessus subsp. massiliense]
MTDNEFDDLCEADVSRVMAHIGARSVSHPEVGATGLFDMTPARFRVCVDVLRERGFDIVEFIVCGGDRLGNEVGYALRGIEYTAVPEVVDRAAVVRAGIGAAGISAALVDEFVELTGEIVQCESAWRPNTVAVDFEHYPLGRVADGADYSAPRGLTGMQPRLFQEYRPAGSSTNIYDPVASIAALWRFASANFGVDLTTGSGLAEFGRFWRAHRGTWWNLPYPPLVLSTQSAVDFNPDQAVSSPTALNWLGIR